MEPRVEIDRVIVKEILPTGFVNNFRLGGWFRRLPTCDPSSCKAPNTGSKQPADIHPHVWGGIGKFPQ